MKHIVITASTRGIGFGLAEAFLSPGCRVVISGRRPESVQKAARALADRHARPNVAGCLCDVTQFEQVRKLWGCAVAAFRSIDIWINNAGVSQPWNLFWEVRAEDIQAVVTTNILGTTKRAVRYFTRDR